MCCTTRFSVQFSTRTFEGCTVAWMELGVWVMYFRYCVPVFFLAVNCCCFNTWCLLPSVPPETQRCSSGAGARGSEHAWQMLALLPPQRAQGPRPQTYLLCRGNARDIYLHAPPVGPQAIGAAASDFPASPLASPAIGTFDSLRPAPRPAVRRLGFRWRQWRAAEAAAEETAAAEVEEEKEEKEDQCSSCSLLQRMKSAPPT